MSSIYKIRPEDRPFAEEFRRNPFGHHSPGLRRILTLFRGESLEGKPALVETRPHREWTLVRLSGKRGAPPVPLGGKTYRDRKEAEWDVFRARWKKHTGETIGPVASGKGRAGSRAARRGLKVPPKRITGYSDRIAVRPGETIRFLVSCDGVRSYRADIVRIVCGDTSPEGPGARETVVRTRANGRYKGRKQVIRPGSYAIVPDSPEFSRLASLSVQAMIWPTRAGHGLQGILSRWSRRGPAGFALCLDESGAVALRLGDGRGRAETVSTGKPLQSGRWYFVGATFDASSGRVRVFQRPLSPAPGVALAADVRRSAKLRRLGPCAAPLVMAGLERGLPGGRAGVGNHFNGKIDSPRIANRALDPAEIESLKGGVPATLMPDIIGAWDFSLDIGSERITDLSPNRLHGDTVNMPARAVTGWNWTGEVMDWRARSHEWGAIKFHDDDLYDAGWDADFELTVPATMRSGLYAARLRSGSDEEYIPFAVGPSPGRTSKIAFLLPTASYMAYANGHSPTDGRYVEMYCGQLTVLFPHDLFLATHREYGGCPYDRHSDGSGIFYSSRLRPVLNMRPKVQNAFGGLGPSRLWQFNADTHITDWLEAMGHAYDVITDEELDKRGLDLLRPYNVVITGSHPEYWSTPMWNALDAYKRHGGRVMYMGGNGFYWRIAFHPTRPGVIEVRRNENGDRSWATPVGEYFHSFDGAYGGLWRSQARAPQSLVGVGFCAQGFDLSSYYRRQPGSFGPKVRFIFKGVGANERIGDFGLIGGGAAGLELDRAEPELGTPPGAIVLASSENHTDCYLVVQEERLSTAPGQGGQENPLVRADMVFFETENGGAVFSTGSIAWSGSLAHSGYRNNISRITNNVLTRFLDPRPF